MLQAKSKNDGPYRRERGRGQLAAHLLVAALRSMKAEMNKQILLQEFQLAPTSNLEKFTVKMLYVQDGAAQIIISTFPIR